MLAITAATLCACTSTVSGQPTAPADLKWQRNITAAVTGLGAALGPVGDAMMSHDFTAMAQACAGLQSPIDRIEHQLPTPDQAVNDALRESVSDYRSFAKICSTLSPTTAPSALDPLSDYLTRGDTAMRRALDHMGIELPAR
jgi:hypothetical protein